MEDVLRRFNQLEETREPFYYDLALRGANQAIRGAGTIEGPFVLRRLVVAASGPEPLVFVGAGSPESEVRLIPFDAVESFVLGPAPAATRG